MQIQRIKYRDLEQFPQIKIQQKFKQDFFGSVPAPFIGRFGYPNINVGILSPQFIGETANYDSPKLWSQNNYQIPNIANLRYGLVNSHHKGNVKQLSSRFIELVQEVGMATKAAEVEINLKKAPQLQFKPEKEIIPFGPQSEIRKARITSNTKIDSKVEKIVTDTDLKSSLGLIELYKKGFEESFLNKILSVGNLGLKKNRKLVPTRWSITAVDDTIGKNLIEEIKQFPVGEHQLYFGGEWGNYYLILFFPEVWSYELFEMYLEVKANPWSKKGFFYSTDYENYSGRKNYAEECAGGYYAARMPVLERMQNNRRQNSALVLRFITPEYNVPLGVWVCREASRKSLTEKAINFSSQELMFKYAEELIKKKFSFDINVLLKESKLLKEKKLQKRLVDY